MSMTQTTVPGTDPARDHAFLLDTGEAVVVNVSRLPKDPTADASAVLISSRMVDPATGAVLTVAGSEVRVSHTATVLHSALAEGLDFAAHLASEMETQAQRLRGVKASLSSLAGIAGQIQPTP